MIPKLRQEIIDDELTKLLGKDIVTRKIFIDPDGYYTNNPIRGKVVEVINFPTKEKPKFLPAYYYIPEAKILVKDEGVYNIIENYHNPDSTIPSINGKDNSKNIPYSDLNLIYRINKLENRIIELEKTLNKRGE